MLLGGFSFLYNLNKNEETRWRRKKTRKENKVYMYDDKRVKSGKGRIGYLLYLIMRHKGVRV